MNRDMLDKIARAVLYEGYILYPYRPSVKNRQRWTFGGLYPRSYSEAQRGSSDAWVMQTECPVVGRPNASIEANIRFLHLIARTVGEVIEPVHELPEHGELSYRPVESLQVGDEQFQTWQEAVERDVCLGRFELRGLLDHPQRIEFAFPARRQVEPLRHPAGQIVGVLVREQQAIRGVAELSARRTAEDVLILRVCVENQTPFEDGARAGRDDALIRSLVSTHVLLGVTDGDFVSLTDPPASLQQAADACQNVGCWPVLIGQEGQKDTVLASPIILSDYPQIAPESPGDLFDGTEIDEILSLRILTLTDQEKRQIAATDERARELLARTEALAREQLLGLHGTVRPLQPLPVEQNHV